MKPSADILAFRFRSGLRPIVLVLVVALGAAGGCSKAEKRVRESAAEAEPAPTSEAAKTRELEDKAAEYKDRYQQIQDSDMSAEQKAQAASELVDEQQRTIREAEDGAAGAGGDDAQH